MGGSGGGTPTFGRGGGDPGLPDPKNVPGGGGGGGGGNGGPDPCESIDVNVNLQSPKPAVVAKLRKADILVLELTNGNAPIVAKDSSGQVAGAVVINEMNTLVNCLKAGGKFVADVLSIVGGAVKVRVHQE